jgi:hypothetical protein
MAYILCDSFMRSILASFDSAFVCFLYGAVLIFRPHFVFPLRYCRFGGFIYYISSVFFAICMLYDVFLTLKLVQSFFFPFRAVFVLIYCLGVLCPLKRLHLFMCYICSHSIFVHNLYDHPGVFFVFAFFVHDQVVVVLFSHSVFDLVLCCSFQSVYTFCSAWHSAYKGRLQFWCLEEFLMTLSDYWAPGPPSSGFDLWRLFSLSRVLSHVSLGMGSLATTFRYTGTCYC